MHRLDKDKSPLSLPHLIPLPAHLFLTKFPSILIAHVFPDLNILNARKLVRKNNKYSISAITVLSINDLLQAKPPNAMNIDAINWKNFHWISIVIFFFYSHLLFFMANAKLPLKNGKWKNQTIQDNTYGSKGKSCQQPFRTHRRTSRRWSMHRQRQWL